MKEKTAIVKAVASSAVEPLRASRNDMIKKCAATARGALKPENPFQRIY